MRKLLLGVALVASTLSAAENTRTITQGPVSITASVDRRHIISMKYNGTEILKAAGNGSGLQVAWQIGDNGECKNPTQAGARDDAPGTSSSILRGFSSSDQPPEMYFVVRPAWWVRADAQTSYCAWVAGNGYGILGHWPVTPPYFFGMPSGDGVHSDSTVRLSAAIVSPSDAVIQRVDLEMSITFAAPEEASGRTTAAPYDLVQAPYIGLSSIFIGKYRLLASTGLWLIVDPGAGYDKAAPVLCNAGETVCVGWYSPTVAEQAPWLGHRHNGFLGHEIADLATTQWAIVVTSARFPVVPVGTQTFRAFMFIGSGALNIRAAMIAHGWPTS